MTFDEWFDRYNNDIQGFYDYYIFALYENGDLTPDVVEQLMREAWEGRYMTLTCNDL